MMTIAAGKRTRCPDILPNNIIRLRLLRLALGSYSCLHVCYTFAAPAVAVQAISSDRVALKLL